MQKFITLLGLLLVPLLEATAIGPAKRQTAQAQNPLLLQQSATQSGSQQDGQNGTPEPGQVPSLTFPVYNPLTFMISDNANFINFCVGKGQLMNGLQQQGPSCNGIPMGQIPSRDKMVSTIILSPQQNQNIVGANQDFEVVIAITHLTTGQFTNPQITYYSAPQQLDDEGFILGHSHITIQNLAGQFNPPAPPDPTSFAFFKGVNNPANGGTLSLTVTGGLPVGVFRLCTMASASNHQAVLMPVAQRGAQDDCVRFSVSN